jgi:hypothetical protein
MAAAKALDEETSDIDHCFHDLSGALDDALRGPQPTQA